MQQILLVMCQVKYCSWRLLPVYALMLSVYVVGEWVDESGCCMTKACSSEQGVYPFKGIVHCPSWVWGWLQRAPVLSLVSLLSWSTSGGGRSGWSSCTTYRPENRHEHHDGCSVSDTTEQVDKQQPSSWLRLPCSHAYAGSALCTDRDRTSSCILSSNFAA